MTHLAGAVVFLAVAALMLLSLIPLHLCDRRQRREEERERRGGT